MAFIDNFVSVDLETTGLNPRLDKIIEIGAVKVSKGVITDRYSTFVNPGRKLEMRIQELTGITQEQVDTAPDIEEVFTVLLYFLEELPLMGHKVLFDYSFLKKAAVDQRMSFEKKGLDTLAIARHYLAGLEHKNLGYLCSYYGIKLKPHRALADAESAAHLYLKMAEEFYEEESALFQPHSLQYRAKRDTPATKPQKERLYKLIEQHRLLVDYDVEKLSRSEVSRYTDKILAEYGR